MILFPDFSEEEKLSNGNIDSLEQNIDEDFINIVNDDIIGIDSLEQPNNDVSNKLEILKIAIPTASCGVLRNFSRRISDYHNLAPITAASCGVLNPSCNK